MKANTEPGRRSSFELNRFYALSSQFSCYYWIKSSEILPGFVAKQSRGWCVPHSRVDGKSDKQSWLYWTSTSSLVPV